MKDSGLQRIKKETPTEVFSCEFSEIFKSTFFVENLRWLLLSKQLISHTFEKFLWTKTSFYFYLAF